MHFKNYVMFYHHMAISKENVFSRFHKKNYEFIVIQQKQLRKKRKDRKIIPF